MSLRTLEVKRNVGRGTPTQCQNPQMTMLKGKSYCGFIALITNKGFNMNNFDIIYKILKKLEKAMDLDEFTLDDISAQVLKVGESRWAAIMEMLYENGYVSGISVQRSADGDIQISESSVRITLKGLEYLSENSFMKKAANVAKGIIETIK